MQLVDEAGHGAGETTMSKTTRPSPVALRNADAVRFRKPTVPPVVVLRESALDCDLPTAIARVRRDQETARSRILIVGPAEEGGDLSDSPHRGAAFLPASLGSDALVRFGARMLDMLECQAHFQDELRATLTEMSDSVRDESRARMQGQLRTLGAVLDWCEELSADLLLLGRRAKAGQYPVDLAWLANHVAIGFAERHETPVEVRGSCAPCWGAEAVLAALLEAALEVVLRRVGGEGPIALELGRFDGRPGVQVRAVGEPHPFSAPRLVARLRSAAEAAAAVVESDPLGPGSVGMVLRLPFVD